MLIQVAHSRCRFVDVGVLQETETFGPASLFVVDEAEVDDGARAGEELADLFFADAWDVLAWLMPIMGEYRMPSYHTVCCQ